MCLLSVYGFCAVQNALGDFFGVNGLRAVNILGGKRDFAWLTSRYLLYQPFDGRSVLSHAQRNLADSRNWHPTKKTNYLVMGF